LGQQQQQQQQQQELQSKSKPKPKSKSKSPTENREPPLQLVSMKESFDLKLLTRFYNELMIPNFPLEEERDDLDDWICCLDPAQNVAKQPNKAQPYPSMDVVLLVKREQREASLLPLAAAEEEEEELTSTVSTTRMTTIVAGVAFEYYKQAQCGLLSYMVVPDEFRRLGIMKSLHPVACHAMQLLHREHCVSAPTNHNNNNNHNNNHNHNSNETTQTTILGPTIKAIFAETNTPEAGDVPPAVIRKRHEILYQLGYRHLKFPYIQPALAEDMESFDEIILLIYSPDKSRQTTIGTEILRDYIVDFFQSVTGYDNDAYKQDWYYKLVEWFWRKNALTDIAQDLPWEDITQDMKECMAKSTTNTTLSANNGTKKCSNDDAGTDSDCNLLEEPQRNHVAVIGAGIAGLVSTVTLAEEYLKHQQHHSQNSSDNCDQSPQGVLPLTITLIEAQPFVGGRIRTVVTKEAEAETDAEFHPLVFSNDRLRHSQKIDSFAPWPVAIGAEFVHGVDSMANQLIEDHDEWLVHETFDLCESPEEYPSRNSFVQRRSSFALPEEQRNTPHVEIFMNGKCYPMQDHPGDDHGSERRSSETENNCIRPLLQRANHIWHNLQNISAEVNSTNDKENGVAYGRDMSLDEFIEDQLFNNGGDHLTSEEVEKIKQILESVYSNTAGTSNKFLGIHEASREEWNWEYTESNFRLEQCFNEFVTYYLDRIDQINEQSRLSNLGVKIDIEIGCPVSEIGSASKNGQNKGEQSPSPSIRVLTRPGRTFVCDKCIVTVPLGVLKAKKLTFSGAYKIPRKIQEAIDTINMFSGMKAHMLLKVGIDIQRISKRMKNTELLFCPGEIFSQVWLRRNKESVFLSGFCVANCRDQLIQMVTSRGKVGDESKSNIAQDLMLDQVRRSFDSSIDDEEKIFVNPSAPTCSSFAFHDWSEDEFTMGIYSSPSVGAGWGKRSHNESIVGDDALPPTHRDNLAKPINNEIWFSGEHANTTTCATVQSAMESGKRAAQEVYRAFESA
jgi:hypothetical protein